MEYLKRMGTALRGVKSGDNQERKREEANVQARAYIFMHHRVARCI